MEKIGPYFPYISILAGGIVSVFGLRLLFQKGYVEKLREGTWKPHEKDLLSVKESYHYDRYVRGIKFFVGGLIFIVFGIISL